NEDAIGDQATEEEGDKDMERAFQASHGDRGKEGGRGKRRERVEEDEDRRGPFRFPDFVADEAQVCVLLAIHEPRGNLWDVTGEQVAANRRAGDPKAYGQPGVEVKLDEQNDEDDPGWRRNNRDRIDRER